MSNLSIYIPRVPQDLANDSAIINALRHLGMIDRIDFVNKENGLFYQAFIHFKYWYPTAHFIMKTILDPNMTMRHPVGISDDARYFILLPTKNPRTVNELRLERQVKALQERIKNLESSPEHHLQPLWAHSEQDVDTSTNPEWLSAFADDRINMSTLVDATQNIDSTSFIESDDYHENYHHDDVYDTDLVE